MKKFKWDDGGQMLRTKEDMSDSIMYAIKFMVERGRRESFSERNGYGSPHQFGTKLNESLPQQKASL